MYLLNGVDITHSQFKINEISYPSNWAVLTTEDERTELGIIEVEEIWPVLGSGEYYDGTYTDTETQRIYNVSQMSN